MAPRLPTIASAKALAAVEQAGFVRVSQRGSHVKLRNAEGVVLTIPMHGGDIKRPLLSALIKQAGLKEDQFRTFL